VPKQQATKASKRREGKAPRVINLDNRRGERWGLSSGRFVPGTRWIVGWVWTPEPVWTLWGRDIHLTLSINDPQSFRISLPWICDSSPADQEISCRCGTRSFITSIKKISRMGPFPIQDSPLHVSEVHFNIIFPQTPRCSIRRVTDNSYKRCCEIWSV
jgi:hypothetical protein